MGKIKDWWIRLKKKRKEQKKNKDKIETVGTGDGGILTPQGSVVMSESKDQDIKIIQDKRVVTPRKN